LNGANSAVLSEPLETQVVLQNLGTIEDVAEAILELDLKFD
jgi:hypothetical protein